MKQNEKMRDFVKSLEDNQLSKDQEAMLRGLYLMP